MDNYLLYALRQYGVRLTCGDKWLVLNYASPVDAPEYIVYWRPYAAKKTKVCYQGASAEDAVNILVR